MSQLDLSLLDQVTRLLFTVPLQPLQGDRFQPTGFPSLGAADYQTKNGRKLLVESAQSMANRFEATCWDSVANQPVSDLQGISHVTVTRGGQFFTDSMLEAHRINSPYLLEGKDKTFFDRLKHELGGLAAGPINRKALVDVLLKFDVGSLLHGVFLAKKELAGGRLRLARALSAFIEASGASVAASGGVKNDHVNPRGDTKTGFGNVPFARDEYVAEEINLYINLDVAQIRGYGLAKNPQELLILLALYRVRKLLDGDLRLRTACDLQPVPGHELVADNVKFALPSLDALKLSVRSAIASCQEHMEHTTVAFEDELKTGKDEKDSGGDESDDDSDIDG